MRILKLPLAGLLFCVMALFAGCKTSNEPKAPVALTWEMGASDISEFVSDFMQLQHETQQMAAAL